MWPASEKRQGTKSREWGSGGAAVAKRIGSIASRLPSTTPLESMPVWLQYVVKVIGPTPHSVVFAQDVLYRGADVSIVWPEILVMAIIGSVYFGFALRRFRRAVFSG